MSDPSSPLEVREQANSSRTADSGQPVSGLQRTASVLRTVLPHLLRLLPLLDGNIGSAVSNLLSSPLPSPPPAPPVDLTPIEDGLEELQAEHRDLRSQILEQSAGLKRVEGRLEMMEQAAARYMLQQQELLKEQRDVGIRLEEMKSAGRKTNIIAFVAIGLLVFSILLNVAVFIYFLHLRP
jgi:hypothetical protein